jgi:tetratricopeptide (TPR) repeat protein
MHVGCFLWLTLIALNAQDVSNKDISHKVAVLEQQAQKYLQQQKPQLAIPVLREIVSLEPGNVNAQANLGVLTYFENNYAEAIPHMRAALQLQPDLWKIEALLGIAEKRTGDPIQARDDLERALSNLQENKIRIEAVRQSSFSCGKAGRTVAGGSADPAGRLSDFTADDGPEPAEHDGSGAGFRADAYDHGRRTRAAGRSHERC